MTTKQIADTVNRPEKTVRTWAKKTAGKSAVMAAKLAASTSTIEILDAGGLLPETVLIAREIFGR